MILQALTNYYDILAKDPDSDIPKKNFAMVKVSFAAQISRNGDFEGLVPMKITVPVGKKTKEVPQELLLFEQAQKTSGIGSNFLYENATYFFGIDKGGKPDRTLKCFEFFRDYNREILTGCDCEEAKAVLAFLEKYPIEFFQGNPSVLESLDELSKGGNIIFRVNGLGFPHESPDIKKAWVRYRNERSGEIHGQCLITGDSVPIAITHPKIKGVRDAQSVGASIVSFNARAYESYGKIDMQGLNAPIGVDAAFAYTTVLNKMLSSDRQKIIIGDTTVVFWAESPDGIYEDCMMSLFEPEKKGGGEETDSDYKRDTVTENIIKEIFDKIRQGGKIGDVSKEIDPSTRVYILGLAPNAARLSIRFFHTDSFGGFIDKTAEHYRNLQIEKEFENQFDFIPMWLLVQETVSPKSRDKTAPPMLAGSMLRAVLSGGKYPEMLFSLIIGRIRADVDDKDKRIARINYIRASIIKAFLTRKYKDRENDLRGALTMALNEQCDNKAYLLGRLFAVLEKAQADANPGLNATIKDRYFSSACANPASVFPTLLKLSQHHISKSEFGYVSDNRIREILGKLQMDGLAFPKRLSLDSQGAFILGYYHQKQAFYKPTKKEDK